MKKILFAALLSFLSLTAICQTPEENAKELLRLSGTLEVSNQVLGQMIESFKKSSPDIPSDFWDEMQKQMNSGKLIELLVPVYIRHYTNEDMLQLIQFYKSPLGKKMIEKTALISQESYTIGEQWGREVATQIMKKMEARRSKN